MKPFLTDLCYTCNKKANCEILCILNTVCEDNSIKVDVVECMQYEPATDTGKDRVVPLRKGRQLLNIRQHGWVPANPIIKKGDKVNV